MDELIGQLAAKAGVDNVVAEKTIGIMLGFLRSEGPSDKVQALIDGIPEAEAAMAAVSTGRQPQQVDEQRHGGRRHKSDGAWHGHG